MFKKLALSTRFLALAFFVLLPFFWHSNEIEVNAAPGYEPVARISLTPTQPAIQSVLPTPTWAAPQTDLKATTLPALQPTLNQTSLPEAEAPFENANAFQQFVESVVDGQAGVLRKTVSPGSWPTTIYPASCSFSSNQASRFNWFMVTERSPGTLSQSFKASRN